MIERNEQSVDVDELMVCIAREVTRRRSGAGADVNLGVLFGRLDTAFIESRLAAAFRRAAVRTKLPARFDVFPWNRFRPLQSVALRLFALCFKDQRQVNFALIAAMRELVRLEHAMHDRVAALEARVRQLEEPRSAREAQLGTDA
jgi:hypothetical protein